MLLFIIFRQPPEMFCKKRCLQKKFANFIGKYLCWNQFLRACSFIKKKLRHRCFSVKFAKFLKIPILKNTCKQLLLYIHFNSHHFHYHHFHFHCKMHLYCLKILLTIPLYSNMIPCLFQLNFVFCFPTHIFSSSIPSFSFFTPSKITQEFVYDHQTNLDIIFILIFLSIVIYTSLFTLNCLYLLTLLILIFSLYY